VLNDLFCDSGHHGLSIEGGGAQTPTWRVGMGMADHLGRPTERLQHMCTWPACLSAYQMLGHGHTCGNKGVVVRRGGPARGRPGAVAASFDSRRSPRTGTSYYPIAPIALPGMCPW